jgi:hypothetical protein
MSTISREYLTKLSDEKLQECVYTITDKVIKVAKTTLERCVTFYIYDTCIPVKNEDIKDNYMNINIPENSQEKVFQLIKEKLFDSEIRFIKKATYKMITIKW